MQIKKMPQRMCIVCREMKEKKDMLRVVKDSSDKIFLDFSSKASGRGAYVCDNQECIKKLRQKRLLNKTFSCAVDDDVYSAIEEEYLVKRKN